MRMGATTSMKRPPCKINGIECEKRYIGCRAECEEYHKWLAKHEAEKEQERKAKSDEIAIDTFLATKGKRIRQSRNHKVKV